MIVVGLYGVLLLAVFFDCARYKIPNALIVAALAVDLVLVGILNEPLAAFYSFIIGLLFILIIFPFYLLGAIGAGDIKLLFVVSIITGFYQAIKIFSVAMLIAGIIGIIKLLFIILRKKDVDREIFINKYFFINKFTKRSLVAKKSIIKFLKLIERRLIILGHYKISKVLIHFVKFIEKYYENREFSSIHFSIAIFIATSLVL